MAGWAALAKGIGQNRTNKMNRDQARINRRFQERMSSTAIQRRMADMRAGGINPVLAARFDASTPPGAMAQMKNVGGAAVEGYTSAKAIQNQTAMTAQQIAESESRIGLQGAQTEQAGQQTQLLQIQQRLHSYGADIREGAAFAIQAVMSLLPEEIRGNPQATADYVKKELQKFISENSSSIKNAKEFLNNAANIVNDLTQKTSDLVGGGPKATPQKVVDKRSKQYEASKRRFFNKTKQSVTFKQWWKENYPDEYKRYYKD